MVFFAMGSAIGQPEGESYGVGQAFAIVKGWFAGWSPARFASESWQAILGGFYNNTLMGAAWILMLACTLALAFWLDWQRNFQFKNKSEELVLTAQKPAVRWALYYALVLFSFAGLVMQNGRLCRGQLCLRRLLIIFAERSPRPHETYSTQPCAAAGSGAGVLLPVCGL